MTNHTDEQIVHDLYHNAAEQLRDAVNSLARENLRPVTTDDFDNCKTPWPLLRRMCRDVHSIDSYIKIDAFIWRCVNRLDDYMSDDVLDLYVREVRLDNTRAVRGVESNIRRSIAAEYQRQVL